MWVPKLATRDRLAEEVVRKLAADIDAGQLAPGERLPTHRELAERLKVAVGTITRAYSLAKSQGLVTGTTGRGTFVSGTSDAPQSTLDLSQNLIWRDPRNVEIRKLLGLHGDPLQTAPLLDADQGAAGVWEHRDVAARWMRRPSFTPSADDIVICSGVQNAMHTVLATIAAPGDMVVTESVTYAGIKAIASLLRLQLRGLPIDAEGLDPEAFEDACRRGAKVLYTTPTLHNPTAAIMSKQRRRDIACIAQAHGVAVLEDDVYGFLAPRAPPPLAAYAPEQTYYLISASKSIAPGLRVGFCVCPSNMQHRVANTVRATIWETAPLMSAIVAKWIEDGAAQQIIEQKQAEVRARHELATRTLSEVIAPAHTSPHWWIALPEPWRAEDLTNECRKHGILISPAATFAINREHPVAVRICLGSVASRQQLQQGLETINQILKQGPTSHFSTT